MRSFLIGVVIILALILDWWLMRNLRDFFQKRGVDDGENGDKIYLWGVYSPVLTWLKKIRPRLQQPFHLATVRLPLGSSLELGLIIAWAMHVGRLYLNFNLTIWPVGGEFIMGMQSNFIWPLLPKCGACILWNGFVNGGTPAFVDLHSGLLHPLVILTTLIWGPINGAKVTAIASLAMGGFALWWLAKVLGLGRVARLWSALLAVASGYLAVRMENGLVALVLSTAACSLVIPPAIDLALNGKRRSAILLAITLALALVSGQGYAQVGLVLALLPALLILLVNERLQLRPVWKEFALAILLALTLAGIFWVPFLHFYPNWVKDSDISFSAAQPMEYEVLNLVIRDAGFYRSESLHKVAAPSLYSNYIGWVPVLLAIAAIMLVPRGKSRLLAFFLVAFGLVYLASGAKSLKLLAWFVPDLAYGVRHSPLIASLSGPLVIGLAAWGLDLLLKVKTPRLSLILAEPSETKRFPSASLISILLVIPLFWSIKLAYDYGRNWLIADKMPLGMETAFPIIQKVIKPGTTQILQMPAGEYHWYPAAVDLNLKMTTFFRPWRWKDREFPPGMIEGIRDSKDNWATSFLGEGEGISLFIHPENQYAYVDVGDRHIPCDAIARGGNIDIDCQNDVPGELVVMENQWTGWSARRDGNPVQLGKGQWLNTSALAGTHHYEFRYRPWDVSVGLILTIIGILLTIWLWWRAPGSMAGRPDVLPGDN